MTKKRQTKKEPTKLVYVGKSNFRKSFIAKVVLGRNAVENNIEKSVLVLTEKNIKELNHCNKNSLEAIILSGDIVDKQKAIIKNIKNKSLFWLTDDISFLDEGDVIEIECKDKTSKLFILYRIHSDNNVLIPINACNNRCIMCPQPLFSSFNERPDIKPIKRIISLMDKNTRFLGISGGEPTLLKDKLIKILSLCKDYLPNTSISLLSNGRMFSYASYVDAINAVGTKNLDFCIPLHSHKRKIHDKITQAAGSFDQTIEGTKNLLRTNQNIELRIVIQKDNVKDLDNIAEFIIDNLYGIFRVSFVGMEVLGMAVKNMNKIWVPYKEIGPYMEKAIIKLLDKGISASIFNIPRCKVSEPFRYLCAKTISEHKIRYLDECKKCKEKKLCGGIFLSSLALLKKEGVEPIK